MTSYVNIFDQVEQLRTAVAGLAMPEVPDRGERANAT